MGIGNGPKKAERRQDFTRRVKTTLFRKLMPVVAFELPVRRLAPEVAHNAAREE
jgi:hypothetical protein